MRLLSVHLHEVVDFFAGDTQLLSFLSVPPAVLSISSSVALGKAVDKLFQNSAQVLFVYWLHPRHISAVLSLMLVISF